MINDYLTTTVYTGFATVGKYGDLMAISKIRAEEMQDQGATVHYVANGLLDGVQVAVKVLADTHLSQIYSFIMYRLQKLAVIADSVGIAFTIGSVQGVTAVSISERVYLVKDLTDLAVIEIQVSRITAYKRNESK